MFFRPRLNFISAIKTLRSGPDPEGELLVNPRLSVVFNLKILAVAGSIGCSLEPELTFLTISPLNEFFFIPAKPSEYLALPAAGSVAPFWG